MAKRAVLNDDVRIGTQRALSICRLRLRRAHKGALYAASFFYAEHKIAYVKREKKSLYSFVCFQWTNAETRGARAARPYLSPSRVFAVRKTHVVVSNESYALVQTLKTVVCGLYTRRRSSSVFKRKTNYFPTTSRRLFAYTWGRVLR